MSKPASRAKKPATIADGAEPKRARRAFKADAPPQSEPVAPSDSASASFVLPADLRIGSAAEVYAGLVARGGEILLDGHGVAKVDAAGMQAVLAALTQIARSGGSWHWHNPSTALSQGAAVLGLGESLRLP